MQKNDDTRSKLLPTSQPKQNMGTVTNKSTFANSFTTVISCIGCMIGFGNTWRFPRIIARASGPEGGLMFIIVWLLFLVIWSSPMMLIEYAIGRYTKKGVVISMKEMMGRNFTWCGGWIAFVSYAVMAYFSVIVGWCIYYVYLCICYELPKSHSESLENFGDFTERSYWPVLMLGLVMVVCLVASIKGVKSIEKVNLFLVPLLVAILVSTLIWSLTREYAINGLLFLFYPDTSILSDPKMWIDAATQSAYDTGAGMGLLIAYSNYMPENTGIVKYSVLVPIANNIVSLMCGVMTFATGFSSLLSANNSITTSEILDFLQQAGPGSTGLTFVWIPVLFSTAGEVIGRIFSVCFFISLCSAGFSSMIPGLELLSKNIQDFGVERKLAVTVATGLYFVGGLGSALSLEFLTNQDTVWAYSLLISGLIMQALVIKFGTSRFRNEVINDYCNNDWYLPKAWEWLIKFVCPLEALFLLTWWVIDTLTTMNEEGRPLYELSTDSFLTTILEWICALFIIVTANVTVILVYKKWNENSYDVTALSNVKNVLSPNESIEDVLSTETEEDLLISKKCLGSGYGTLKFGASEDHSSTPLY